MYKSMLWSVLKTIRENDGRTNDDREKDVVPILLNHFKVETGPAMAHQRDIILQLYTTIQFLEKMDLSWNHIIISLKWELEGIRFDSSAIRHSPLVKDTSFQHR